MYAPFPSPRLLLIYLKGRAKHAVSPPSSSGPDDSVDGGKDRRDDESDGRPLSRAPPPPARNPRKRGRQSKRKSWVDQLEEDAEKFIKSWPHRVNKVSRTGFL